MQTNLQDHRGEPHPLKLPIAKKGAAKKAPSQRRRFSKRCAPWQYLQLCALDFSCLQALRADAHLLDMAVDSHSQLLDVWLEHTIRNAV